MEYQNINDVIGAVSYYVKTKHKSHKASLWMIAGASNLEIGRTYLIQNWTDGQEEHGEEVVLIKLEKISTSHTLPDMLNNMRLVYIGHFRKF